MKKNRKTNQQSETNPQEQINSYLDKEANLDPENLFNLGPTGHSPDICFSDADSGL